MEDCLANQQMIVAHGTWNVLSPHSTNHSQLVFCSWMLRTRFSGWCKRPIPQWVLQCSSACSHACSAGLFLAACSIVMASLLIPKPARMPSTSESLPKLVPAWTSLRTQYLCSVTVLTMTCLIIDAVSHDPLLPYETQQFTVLLIFVLSRGAQTQRFLHSASITSTYRLILVLLSIKKS